MKIEEQIKATTEKNKKLLKEIDELDRVYCANLKSITKTQIENVLIKSKQRKLRNQIKQVRAIRERALTGKEREELITEIGKCEECPNVENLTIHHKKKLAEGGTNERSNLQVLCLDCHRKKHPINDIAVKRGEIK